MRPWEMWQKFRQRGKIKTTEAYNSISEKSKCFSGKYVSGDIATSKKYAEWKISGLEETLWNVKVEVKPKWLDLWGT